MSDKPNCWEIKDCGRGPGCEKVSEMGLCPAATDRTYNGVNGGLNGGRFCWVVAGTFCGGKVQGTYAQKIDSCMHCEVFSLVRDQEGDQCRLSRTAGTIADILKKRMHGRESAEGELATSVGKISCR